MSRERPDVHTSVGIWFWFAVGSKVRFVLPATETSKLLLPPSFLSETKDPPHDVVAANAAVLRFFL